MDKNATFKMNLDTICKEAFFKVYGLLSINCHDTDSVRLTKNQLSLAFEMVQKSIQTEAKEELFKEGISEPVNNGHN